MCDYPITIFPSVEDEGWIAEIPDLPGCSAFGESPEEALREVLAAKRLWIETKDADRAMGDAESPSERRLPPALPTDEQIADALRRAHRTMLIEHKRAGVPVVVWEDGKIVHIPPEEIVIPELSSRDEDS
ncbi:MAG: type II toxin-antitoxin system HicB family antitoxin [Candidatus Hydrogenedentes bacterium]|nr:type II toxin-antitoxin system HicB family antitoxin [Candidatus Hydrogenedentota bacterium]